METTQVANYISQDFLGIFAYPTETFETSVVTEICVFAFLCSCVSLPL